MQPTHFLYLATPPRPTFVLDATPAEYEILNRHFAYMQQLADQGKLLLTGPTLDGKYGVAILSVTTQEEAQTLVDADPAVVAGLFQPNLHPLAVGIGPLSGAPKP
jgi:uncharacterized protein YciI